MLALRRSAAAARLESQSRKPKPVLAPQQKASLHVQAALASSCQSHHYAERTRGHTEEHRVRQPTAVTINREHFKKISTCLKAAVCPSYDRRMWCSPGALQKEDSWARLIVKLRKEEQEELGGRQWNCFIHLPSSYLPQGWVLKESRRNISCSSSVLRVECNLRRP